MRVCSSTCGSARAIHLIYKFVAVYHRISFSMLVSFLRHASHEVPPSVWRDFPFNSYFVVPRIEVTLQMLFL